MRLVLALATVVAGCGDDGPAPLLDAAPAADAPPLPDAGPTPPFVGPINELPLLPPRDDLPYNHSAECQIAASGDRVVVAFLSIRFVSADAFDVDANFIRTVGVAVSTDRGQTFAQIVDPGFGIQVSDPNVRVDPDGRFWLAAIDFDAGPLLGTIAHSDDGVSWTRVVDDEVFDDKNWMVIDRDTGDVTVAVQAGWWRVTDAGITRAAGGRQYVGGYVRAGRASMTAAGTGEIGRWDGSTAPTIEPAPGEIGITFFHTVSLPLGPSADGGEWFLRPTGNTTAAPLKLLTISPAGARNDIELSEPGAITFLPAADLDAQDRLHIVYYDSGGPAGRLLYTHSLTSDLTAGFTPLMVIDDNATPAAYFPDLTSETGGRRVREYIDLQVVGSRAYIAWTHAPTAPSRVRASYVQFE